MTYKIVFEHWRVPDVYYYGYEKGKPDSLELLPYSRKEGFMEALKWLAGIVDVPATHGGKTICHVLKDDVEIATGEALCSMSDNFCYRTGRKLALGRAWKHIVNSNDRNNVAAIAILTRAYSSIFMDEGF